MIRLSDINKMACAEFVAAFGDVAEHSPWLAEKAWQAKPFRDREGLIEAFAQALDGAPREAKLALIRAHPDLATRAKLTVDSSSEQTGAGLDRLTADEFRRFGALNDAYKARFGFPFIFAVKGATKGQILGAFEERIANSRDDEFANALAQVTRIFRFRLEDRVAA
jgi:2-oxo-4-hydroxy-4-carboxy-5-ureidoimidazoline decarboxylase